MKGKKIISLILSWLIIFSSVWTTITSAADSLADLNSLLNEWNGPYGEIDSNINIWKQYWEDIKKFNSSFFYKLDNIVNKIVKKYSDNALGYELGNILWDNTSSEKKIENIKKTITWYEKNLTKVETILNKIKEIVKKKWWKQNNIKYKVFGYLYYKLRIERNYYADKITSLRKELNKLQNQSDNNLKSLLDTMNAENGTSNVQTGNSNTQTGNSNTQTGDNVQTWNNTVQNITNNDLYNIFRNKLWHIGNVDLTVFRNSNITTDHKILNLAYLGEPRFTKINLTNTDLNIKCNTKNLDLKWIKRIIYTKQSYSWTPNPSNTKILYPIVSWNSFGINLKNIDLNQTRTVLSLQLTNKLEYFTKSDNIWIYCQINSMKIWWKTYSTENISDSKFEATFHNIKNTQTWNNTVTQNTVTQNTVTKTTTYCIAKRHPSGSIYSSSNKIQLVKYDYVNNNWKETVLKTLGSFKNNPSAYDVKYNFWHRSCHRSWWHYSCTYTWNPTKWYDLKKVYKWTKYEWLTDQDCFFASSSLSELKNKLISWKQWKTADNFNGWNLNRNDNFWTVFTPKKWIVKYFITNNQQVQQAKLDIRLDSNSPVEQVVAADPNVETEVARFKFMSNNDILLKDLDLFKTWSITYNSINNISIYDVNNNKLWSVALTNNKATFHDINIKISKDKALTLVIKIKVYSNNIKDKKSIQLWLLNNWIIAIDQNTWNKVQLNLNNTLSNKIDIIKE